MKETYPRKLKEHSIKVQPLGNLLFTICVMKDTVFLLYTLQKRKRGPRAKNYNVLNM